MMLLFLMALVMGGIGSLHCIGMCGPLALSLPLPAGSMAGKLLATFLYNAGRTVTYAALGGMAGLLGASFTLFGFQQWLSLITGIIIIVYLVWPRLAIYKNGHTSFQLFFGKIRSILSHLFRRHNYQSVFFIGLLNGLLPCGLIYMALAAAVATGSLIKSAFFMAAFGLGTLPLMWSIAFWGHLVSLRLRTRIKKLYPHLLFAMACLLIVRGLGLGIRHISPTWHPGSTTTTNSIECHETGNPNHKSNLEAKK